MILNQIIRQEKNLKNVKKLSIQSATLATQSKKTSNFNYCLESVKINDFEGYMTSLIGPKEILRAAFVLKALNIELLSIPKSPRESKISIGKLQFWKDQIDKAHAKATAVKKNDENSSAQLKLNEPISNELSMIINQHGLSKSSLYRLVEGRRIFFTTQQFQNLDELEKCADLSNIHYLLFNSMGIKSPDCDHAANHVGKAQFLCGIAKNLLKRSTQSAYYLPQDLMIKHKISQQDLINFSERVLRAKQQDLKNLAFDLCSRAKQHLNSARALSAKVPRESRLILATSVGNDVFLTKMQKFDFDLMNPKLKNDFRASFMLKLILAKIKNNY